MKKTTEELRKFGLTMALILIVFSAISLYKHGEFGILSTILVFLASLFGVFGLLNPEMLRTIDIYWTKLAEAIHSVMTPVILIITYYILITPIGLLVRLLGKDILQLKIDKNKSTYWDKVDQEGSAKRYYTPY